MMLRPLTILLVGGKRNDGDLIENTLRSAGFVSNVTGVRTAADIVRAAKRTRPHIIVSARVVRVASIVKALRTAAPDAPLILLVSSRQEKAAIRAMARGACDYVLRGRPERLAWIVARELSLSEKSRECREKTLIAESLRSRCGALLSSFGEGYYRARVDGVLVEVGPALCQRSGYSAEELIGMNVRDVYCDPSDRDRFMTELAARGIIENFDTRIMKKSGDSLDVSINAVLVRDDAGRPIEIEGTLRDISARKRMEDALRGSEERYRLLIESSRDGIVVLDREGRFLFANSAAAAYRGRKAEELVGKTLFDVYEREVAERYMAGLEKSFDIGKARTSEEAAVIGGRTVRFSDDFIPMRDNKGQLFAFQIVARDVTSIYQAQETQRKTERLYRALAENFPNGGVFLFDRNLRFTLAEGQGLRKVGPPKGEIVGHTLAETFDAELCRILEPIYKSALKGAASFVEARYADRVYAVHVVPIPDEDGRISVGMAMTQDITQSKAAEEERETLIRQLQEALASVKTLSGLVPICYSCHKIRNDDGYWQRVDEYIREHSDVRFSHGLCSECAQRLYPDLTEQGQKKTPA